LLKNYHKSAKAKRLEKDFQDAIDALNKIIEEWNDIVMEDYNARNKDD